MVRYNVSCPIKKRIHPEELTKTNKNNLYIYSVLWNDTFSSLESYFDIVLLCSIKNVSISFIGRVFDENRQKGESFIIVLYDISRKQSNLLHYSTTIGKQFLNFFQLVVAKGTIGEYEWRDAIDPVKQRVWNERILPYLDEPVYEV